MGTAAVVVAAGAFFTAGALVLDKSVAFWAAATGEAFLTREGLSTLKPAAREVAGAASALSSSSSSTSTTLAFMIRSFPFLGAEGSAAGAASACRE